MLIKSNFTRLAIKASKVSLDFLGAYKLKKKQPSSFMLIN